MNKVFILFKQLKKDCITTQQTKENGSLVDHKLQCTKFLILKLCVFNIEDRDMLLLITGVRLFFKASCLTLIEKN